MNELKIYDFTVAKTYQKLSKRLKTVNIKFVSVDVFDTLLIRKNDDENHRFFMVSKIASSLLKIETDKIFEARLFAHHACYSIRLNNESEPSISKIFAVMCNYLGIDNGKIDKLIEIELDFETTQLTPNKNLISVLNSVKDKKIILLSDMYLTSKHILSLLEKLNVKLPDLEIFSSSDLGLSKRSGSSFQILSKNNKMTEGLHIGDNLVSDILNAQKHKLSTFYLRHTHVK